MKIENVYWYIKGAFPFESEEVEKGRATGKRLLNRFMKDRGRYWVEQEVKDLRTSSSFKNWTDEMYYGLAEETVKKRVGVALNWMAERQDVLERLGEAPALSEEHDKYLVRKYREPIDDFETVA